MQNPAKSLAILLLVIVAVALAACNNSSDDGRITALEEGLSRAEAQERKSREAAADKREEIAERLSALERAEAERNTNEEMNAETRSLVMSLLTGMPGGSGVGGMRPHRRANVAGSGDGTRKAAAKGAALRNGGCQPRPEDSH